MMLDCGTSFLYAVNVRNASDYLCYSQVFAGILELLQWRKKWKYLKAATAFQIFCVYFKPQGPVQFYFIPYPLPLYSKTFIRKGVGV